MDKIIVVKTEKIRKRSRLNLLIAGALLIAGCLVLTLLVIRSETAANDPFVGSWKANPTGKALNLLRPESGASSADVTLELSQFGDFKIKADLKVSNSSQAKPQLEGKYEILNGGKFRLRLVSKDGSPSGQEHLYHYRVSLAEFILVDEAGNKYSWFRRP